ncbi:MAG: hypothetical protein MUC63_09735, partial [Planctomycetes bacterium]|nr:hypothetical protein [Planctomycetota bacterium]
MAPVRRFLPPLLLAAATAAAAAWWAVEVVHVPAKVRRDLSAGLGSWFPGGVRFRSASRIGPRAYRMLDFEAFPSGSDRPWLTAASVELVQSEDGSRIERLRLGSPLLRLGGGPSLLLAGAFRMAPGTTGALPEVEAVGGTLLAALPGGGGAAVPVA